MNDKILEALHLAKTGKGDDARQIAQSREGDPDFDRLHAFLHRMEGDEWNAGYWYRRCSTDVPKVSLEEELEGLIQHYKS